MQTILFALSLSAGSTLQAPAMPRPDTVPVVDAARPLSAPLLSTPLLAPPVADAPMLGVPLLPDRADAEDTVRRKPRPKAIEYSDWYQTRLQIHKAASWATLPLFVGQYYTGETLITKGTDSPTWVKRVHPILATGVLALFATNTVTGVWNLWEGREDPKGRTWNVAHSILMLASDAGFAYVGALSKNAKTSGTTRDQHKAAALTSAGLALVSYAMMLSPFRQDQ